MNISIKDDEVQRWIGNGKVIASFNNDDYGEFYALVEKNNTYRILRCFWLGEEIAVSCDFSENNAEDLLKKMFFALARD